MNEITAIWRTWAEQGIKNKIVLENHDHEAIASISLKSWFNYTNPITITETNGIERYYLFIPDLGLGICFSYYRKMPDYMNR